MADNSISRTTQTTTTTTTTNGKPPEGAQDTKQKLDDLTKTLEKLLDALQDKGDQANEVDKKKKKGAEELLELLEKLASGDIKPEEMEKLGKLTGINKDDLEAAKGDSEDEGDPSGG